MLEQLSRPLYAIQADTGTGRTIVCMSWRGNPEKGIEVAKQEAKEFDMFDLVNFRAELIREGE